MVTISESTRRTTYQPTTPTTVFPVGYPIFDNDDLRVTINGEPFLSFTVSGTYINGIATDAAINVTGPGITGDVVIDGYRLPRRTDQYKNGAPLKIEDHNYSLNRVEVTLQELRRDVNDNSATLNEFAEDVQRAVDAADEAESSAELAEAAAEAAAAAAGNNWSSFSTVSSVQAANIPSPVSYLRTAGHTVVGDGGGALYKRSLSEPVHAGKIQSSDGAWWELASTVISPLMFGAKGDGVTDDKQPLRDAIGYFKNPSLAGLPGNVARRNLRRYLDLQGRIFATSGALNLDQCYGLYICNGVLLATGTWTEPNLITVPKLGADITDNIGFQNLIIQCNDKCNGIYLNECSLYQINNVYVYGYGRKSYGIKTAPTNFSASSTITDCILLPYITYNEFAPTEYGAVGIDMGHNDVIISSVEVAAGYCAFLIRGSAVQLANCHPWCFNAGNNPLVRIEGYLVNIVGNYIDGGVVWIKSADLNVSVTSSFFLAGASSPTSCIIVESKSLNQVPTSLTFCDNHGYGGYTDFVTFYSDTGTSWGNTNKNVVIENNNVINYGGAATFVKPKATKGTISAYVDVTHFNASNITTINISNWLARPQIPNTGIQFSFSVSQNTTGMNERYVVGHFYDNDTGKLHVKLNAATTCYMSISFDQSGSYSLLTAALP